MSMFTVLVNMELQKIALDLGSVPDFRNLPNMNVDTNKVKKDLGMGTDVSGFDANKVKQNLQQAQPKMPKFTAS